MRRISNKLLFIGVFMLLALGMSSLVVRTANAATWDAPLRFDNAGVQYIRNGSSLAYGDSYPATDRLMEYVVSYDDYTDILQTDILVYMPTKTGTINIINKDLCTNTSTAIANSDANYVNMPAGTRMTTYNLITNTGVPINTGYGYWDYSGPGACANNTLSLTATAANSGAETLDPATGMYIYRIRANAVTGGAGGKFSNGFHIVAPANSYISQDSNSSASSFGMQPSFPIPGPGNNPNSPTPPDPWRVYTDLDIPFGPDCSLLPGQNAVKTFDIYDVDYGDYDVQPQPFHLQLLKYNRTTGAFIGTTPVGVVSGSAAQQAPLSSNIWRPTGGNQTTTRFSFTADGDEIYKLRIYNLYYDNTLQFKIPYDSVWFFKQCQTNTPRHIRAVTSMTPNPVENGQTLTGKTSIVNATNNSFNSTVDFTRRVWADRNRNGVYDAGDTNILGPQSGTTFVPPSPGDRPVVPDWTAVADSATMGGRVCVALGISAAAPVIVDAPAISISCADIGKKPKVQVIGGDVFAGGTFRNAAGTCPAQATPPLGIIGSTTVIGATTYSSFTQYGALSLGQINLFGANNAPPGYPFANALSFGNTTNLGYFYSAGRGVPTTGNPLQARCLNDPFAVYSPKASTTSASTSVDLATAGANLKLTASGTIQIGTGSPAKPIPAGKRIVVYAPNATTVEIRNDIAYADGPYASIDQIPQVVVLTNGNIVVDASVKRIDGLYAAKGNFTTCEVQPRLDTCTDVLEVNGMVVAGGTVKPFRTAGATSANYSERAEVFRLRPDAFLNQAGGSTDDIIRTVDQREVPPRF